MVLFCWCQNKADKRKAVLKVRSRGSAQQSVELVRPHWHYVYMVNVAQDIAQSNIDNDINVHMCARGGIRWSHMIWGERDKYCIQPS